MVALQHRMPTAVPVTHAVIDGMRMLLLLLLEGVELSLVKLSLPAVLRETVQRRASAVRIAELIGVVHRLLRDMVAGLSPRHTRQPIARQGEVHEGGVVSLVIPAVMPTGVCGFHLFSLELALDALAVRRVANEGKDRSDTFHEL